MVTIDYIFNNFKITNEEFEELEKEFGKLCHHASWDLKRKNSKNNLTDEIEDIAQDIRWSMSKAGVYTKRQRYIEACMVSVKKYVTDPFFNDVIEELEGLWSNRKRHGANKQKFGTYQEIILDTLVKTYVPESERPDKASKLEIDDKFARYCRTIMYNCSKNLGKKITRDRRIRSGLVSLSEHSHLDGE